MVRENEIRKPRKLQREHKLPARILRMSDELWDFLEYRKKRTGVSVSQQLRDMVQEQQRRSG